MLINFTNHPSKNWSEKQLEESKKYGQIEDFPYPQIDPNASETEIVELAKEYASKIAEKKPEAVLVAGEFSFFYAIVTFLLREKITVLCSCSERDTAEVKNPDGTVTKTACFNFVQYRSYNKITL